MTIVPLPPKSDIGRNVVDDDTEDDLNNKYIEALLPDMIKIIKNAGLMHEFKEFHRMLAENTFPLDNISFLTSKHYFLQTFHQV